MIYAQNEKLFGALHKDMMGIGTMMNDIGKIQAAAMQNMDKNSSQYYTQSIKLDTERNAILKEMLEMQRKMYESSAAKERAEREKGNSKKRMRWNDIQYNGMPDLGNYAKLVGSNIKNLTGMLNMPGMDGDSNMLASMMVSPLQYMMEFAVKGIIPATIKEATKELNDTIAGVFGLTMSRMHNAKRKGSGGIWEMLSNVFGVNLDPNRTIDTTKYERGPIPFDGITRKAIIDVIPTYLRRIEAHLTGKRERAYDYDSGRWVTGEEVKKELERVKERYEKSGTSEFMRDFSKQSKKIAFTNESDSNKYFKAQRELEKYLFEVGGDINIDVGPAGNGVNPAKYPNLSDPNVWKMITSTIRSMYTFTGANGKSNFKSSKIMGLAKNVNEAKANEDRFYRSLEEGTSAIKSFLSSGLSGIDKHGDTDKNGNFNAKSPYMTFKDEHGNSLFNYLQNINKELSFIRINGIRGWGDGSYKNNSKFVPFDRIDIKNPNWSNPNTNNNKTIEQKEAENAYKNALENAKRGKAITFTDLDRLDAKQLANLMGAIRDSATNEHNAELRSMVDSNAISSYLDKRFGTDKTSLEEVNRRRKAGNKAADEDEYAGLETNDPVEKNFVQKIMEKINKAGSLTRAISSTGTEIFRDMLYSADAAIYHMFFKSDLSSDDKNKKKFKGFMDFMADKINTTFEKVSNYFKDHVLDPLKEKLGITEDSKQRFKDTFSGMAKGLGRMYVQANKDVFGESYKYFTGEEFGSKKAKYGLTPDPTLKPIANKNLINEIYDTKQPTKTPAIKGKQVGDTAAPVLDFDSLGGLAKGTMGRPFMGKSMLSKGELIFNSRGVSMINKTGAYSVNEPSHILNSEDSHTLLTGMGINAGPKHSIASSLAKEKAEKNRLFGTNNGRGIAHHGDANIKIDGTDITLGELLSTAKKYAPETAAGGAMGGLLGLLVGGPLIGAAIGGASMLIKNSDTLKKKLFGDEKQEGGLIPAKIQQSVMKYFPSMAKYGMAGILPGLITPFGPLGGLLLGGAFGFLKQNEDFKERYFGENGKLKITKKEQDILKKMFPAAGKGAIAGLVGSVIVGGPFGLLGSAALGAGLGMMGATDEFKNMLLGIEVDGVRSGGIVGAFKETISPLTDAFRNLGKSLLNTFDKNIIDPLSRFVRPAIHAIPQVLGIIPRKINDWVKDKVFKTGKTVMEKWFGKDSIAGKAARGAIGLAGLPFKAMTAPFRALGLAGDAIKMRQINTMNASYMTAEERMEFMKSKNKKVSDMDIMMAGADKDTLKELRENLTYRTDNVNAIQKKAKSSGSEILRMLDGFQGTSGGKISVKARGKIAKALNSENSEKTIMNILAKEGLTKEEFNQLMHGDNDLAGKLANYNDLYNRKRRAQGRSDKGMSEADAKVQEILRKSGIKNFDINNTHDVEKLIANLTTEIDHKDAMTDEENEANEKAWNLDNERNKKLDDLVAATKMQVQLLGALNGLSYKDIENKLKDNINKISSGQEPDMDFNNLKALAQTADARNATEANINEAEGVINYTKDKQADYLMGKYVDPTGASDEELKNLRDAATRPSEGRKLSNLYRGGGANKLFKMAAKHKLSIEQMSALGESVGTFISFIKGCNLSAKWFDVSAAKHIVSLDPVDRKSLMTLISLNGFRMWVIARKTPLTDKDLKSISLRTANAKNDRNEFNSRFETASNNIKKFNTIESVVNMSTADWVNGGKSDIINPGEASNVSPVDGGETTETGEGVASNGLGTMLLGGAKALLGGGAKLIGGLFKGGAKLAGKAVGGADRFIGNRVNSLLNGGEIVENGYASGQTPMNLDETDKAGDGRDVVPTSEGMALIKRGTDGSVDYDTTDSGTKSVLQKLGLKKKFAEKLHAAQLRASELTTKVFGETEEEKRKNKLGMLGLILGGTFLAKTGIFKKLFEGVIKPLWDDHLKPFIFDKALPWIGDTLPKLVSGAVKLIADTLPGLVSGAVQLVTKYIPDIISGAVKTIITNFPTLLKAFGVGLADGVNDLLKKTTNNDHGEGTSTTTTKDNLKQAYDKDGNLLTGDDLKNATEIYNEQGAKGEIDKNGNITFKDESFRYATLAHTVGGASLRALLKGGLPGAELASKALNFVGKHGGPSGKVLKVAGKAILAPIKAAGNIGRGAMNMFVERGMTKAAGGEVPGLVTDVLNRAGGAKLGQGIDKAKGAATNVISKVASKANKMKDAAKIAIDSGKYLAANPELAGAATKTEKVISKVVGVGNKFKDFLNTGRELTRMKEVMPALANKAGIGQKTASVAAKAIDGAKDISSKIPGILDNLSAAINKAFSDGPILKKFKSVLNVFGKLGDKVTKVLLSIKEKLFTFFSKVITTNAPKVSAEVIKKAADKAFFVIGIVQGIADFTIGCDQAEAILGVPETNIFEEFMCGIVNFLCGLSIILTIVPGVPTIARECLKFILGFMGKEGDLEARQKEADAEWEKYKEETGSTESKDEYLKNNKSVSGKIGKVVGKAWDSTKKFVGGAIDGAKEFIGNAATGVKNIASGAWEGIKTGASAVGNFVGNAASKVGDFIGGAVDGLGKAGASLLDGISQVGKFVIKGDIGGLMGFNTGIEGTETYEGNLARPVVGIIKTMSFIPTVISAGVHKVGDFVGGIVENVIKVGKDLLGGVAQVSKYVLKGDIIGLMGFNSGVKDTESYEGNLAKPVVGAIKLVSFMPTVISAIVHKVGDVIGGLIDVVKSAGSGAIGISKDLGAKMIDGDLKGFMDYSSPTYDNPVGNAASMVFTGFSKAALFMPTLISSGIHLIGDNIGNIINTVKSVGSGAIGISKDLGAKMIDGDLRGLIRYEAPTYDNPVGDIASKIFTGVSKVALFVPTTISDIIHKIGDGIGALIGVVKSVGLGAMEISTGLGEKMREGDIGGLIDYAAPEYGNPVGDIASKIFTGVGKVALFVPTTISAGITIVGNAIGKVIDGAKAVGNEILNIGPTLGHYMIDGDLSGLMDYESSTSKEEGPMSVVSSILTTIGKVTLFVPTAISSGVHSVVDFVGNIAKSGADNMTKTNQLVDDAINGKVSIFSSEYWDTGDSGDGVAGFVSKGFNLITRLISVPRVIIGSVFKGLGDFFNGIVDWVGGFFDGVKDFFSDPLGFIYKKFTEASPEPGEVQQQSQNVADGLHGGYGTSRSKFGRGYSKQNDPSIANIGFNSRGDSSRQTIGDSACGPTAAVNVMESMYGRGGNEVLKAANYALKGGYKERDGGTRPEFFTNYFRDNGLDSEMSTNRSQLAANINSGMPTVLMGSDANGTSGRTPYGRNPHYVTVTGTDGRGNAIVQDPEAKKDNQLYNMNTLLNKSNLGISAYGRGGRIPFHRILPTHAFGKYGLGKWGRGEATIGADGLLTGKVINIPPGKGAFFVYMAWRKITGASYQLTLKQKAGEKYDSDGFAKIGDRWVIACTSTFGVIGDYVDFYQSNGNVFKCIIGDLKNPRDPGWCVWGHSEGKNVIEFVTNWPDHHINPGTKNLHPEWGGQTVVKAVNGGSFFTPEENLAQRKFLYKRYNGLYPGIGPNGEWTKVDGDTTSSGTVTNMGGVYSGVDGATTSGDSSQQQEPQGILNIFSNLLDNSLAGKALAAFTGGVSGSDSSSSSSSSSSIGGADNFSGTAGRYEGDATGDPKKLLEAAASQVGYKEDHSRKDNSGRSWSKFGDWFGMPYDEWCAMFVSWAANQAGISTKVIPKHAYTPAGADAFTKMGAQLVSPQNASPGDIVYFYYPRAGRIAHIGIVEKGGDAVHTIEGNTGANIDEVARHTYQFSDKTLNKIFRPNYEVPNGSTNNIASNNAIASPTTNASNKFSSTTISATGTWGNGPKPASNLGTFKAGPVKNVGYNINNTGNKLEKGYKTSGIKNGDVITYNGRRIAASGTSSPKYGMGDANLSSNIIVQLLYKIADNTDKLGMILDILSDKLNLKIDSKDVHKHTSPVNLKRKIRDALNNRSGIKDSNDSRSIEDMITSMRLVASQ